MSIYFGKVKVAAGETALYNLSAATKTKLGGIKVGYNGGEEHDVDYNFPVKMSDDDNAYVALSAIYTLIREISSQIGTGTGDGEMNPDNVVYNAVNLTKIQTDTAEPTNLPNAGNYLLVSNTENTHVKVYKNGLEVSPFAITVNERAVGTAEKNPALPRNRFASLGSSQYFVSDSETSYCIQLPFCRLPAIQSGEVPSAFELKYTVSDGSGDYVSTGRSITITVTEPTWANITYSTDGSTWQTTVPVYYNAGSYTTYYKIEATGYNTVEGQATTTIIGINISLATATGWSCAGSNPLTGYAPALPGINVGTVSYNGSILVEGTDYTVNGYSTCEDGHRPYPCPYEVSFVVNNTTEGAWWRHGNTINGTGKFQGSKNVSEDSHSYRFVPDTQTLSFSLNSGSVVQNSWNGRAEWEAYEYFGLGSQIIRDSDLATAAVRFRYTNSSGRESVARVGSKYAIQAISVKLREYKPSDNDPQVLRKPTITIKRKVNTVTYNSITYNVYVAYLVSGSSTYWCALTDDNAGLEEYTFNKYLADSGSGDSRYWYTDQKIGVVFVGEDGTVPTSTMTGFSADNLVDITITPPTT